MKRKKLFCALIMAGLLVSVLSPVASAASIDQSYNELQTVGESIVTPYAIETQWYYRIYDGHMQKRLWSITYGIWLTDWVDC